MTDAWPADSKTDAWPADPEDAVLTPGGGRGAGVLSGAGGQFRLCWCAEDATCVAAEHFRTDMGHPIELIKDLQKRIDRVAL